MEETYKNIDNVGSNNTTYKPFIRDLPTPHELYNKLNEYVIGQELAKKKLCTAFANHLRRIAINSNIEGCGDEILDGIEIEKSNVIMMGGTGTGKTYLIKTLAKMINVPCYICDCTKLTESGYVGEDVENALVGLLRESEYCVDLAQIGIVVLDEIDKLACRTAGVSLTRDVGGEGVQQGLLKIIEGGLVGVPPLGGRKHPEQELIYMDTTNILFIGLGAFSGMGDIIRRRLNTKKIGFTHMNIDKDEECGNILRYAGMEDLRRFGLIPEFVGRFPIISYTNELTMEDMINIMKRAKNSIINQYRKMLRYHNIKLSFTEGAYDEIAKYTLLLGTGARGLRSVIEMVLSDILFDLMYHSTPQDIIIDEDYVKRVIFPIYQKVA